MNRTTYLLSQPHPREQYRETVKIGPRTEIDSL